MPGNVDRTDELRRLKIVEDKLKRLSTAVFGVGSGGVAALSWVSLTSIWTPATGVGPNPFGFQPSCRYAIDQDFFYLEAVILLGGPWVSGTPDPSTAPSYDLGTIANVASEPWLPSTIAEDQSWGMPAAVGSNSVGEGPACGISLTLPVISGSGSFVVVFDGGSGTPTGTAVAIQAALPWHPGVF